MGHHPETLAFRLLGLSVWHVDPCKPVEGQRSDDSCAWFDRRPGEYAAAEREFLNFPADMHDLQLTLNRMKHVPMARYGKFSEPRKDMDRAPGFPRLSQADTLAAVLSVALRLEQARWSSRRAKAPRLLKPFVKHRDVAAQAFDLALNSVDNLSSVDDAARMVRLIAASLNRYYRPWWRHPRWHVHHWRLKGG